MGIDHQPFFQYGYSSGMTPIITPCPFLLLMQDPSTSKLQSTASPGSRSLRLPSVEGAAGPLSPASAAAEAAPKRPTPKQRVSPEMGREEEPCRWRWILHLDQQSKGCMSHDVTCSLVNPSSTFRNPPQKKIHRFSPRFGVYRFVGRRHRFVAFSDSMMDGCSGCATHR